MPDNTEQAPIEFVNEDNVVETGFSFLEKEEVAEIEQQSQQIENENSNEIVIDLSKPEEVVAPETTQEVVDEEVIAPIVEENKDEYLELDEKTAWDFIKNKKGLTADNLDEFLTPKEQKKYAPEIEKFQEFVEKTGNHSYKDFEATQKDWTQESSEIVLKELLKKENPTLDKEDIDFLYEDRYVFDEDIDSDRDIKSKQIKAKVDLQNAHSYLDKQKEDYMVKGGSDDYIPEEYRNAKVDWDNLLKQQEDNDLAFKSNRNDYVAKTESVFSSDFDGFKIKLGNDTIGFEEVSIKPENLQDIKSNQLDIANFNKKFFDEKTGNLEKPKEWHEALYMANNYKAELNKAYNRGIAKQLELDDKLSKNIQPDNIKSQSTAVSTGYTFFVE